MADRITDLSLEDIMGERFGRYSKYIIQERALPDIRDGLKPVQRRILFAMDEDGNTYNKPYRKSAKSVGNVMGNYHPHGDSSIYEAMVRLSQDWKVREPLIDMNGNNGSIDNDPPAAMRYTEARLSPIANEMLEDLDKKTVDMVLNFDDTSFEPTVLPSKIPNLLVNGASGISAGYATNIPTHNLSEIIDATIYLLAHPKASVADLMEFVKGPDFPTGGIVQGIEGLKDAYETGKGRIIVRSKLEVTELKGGKKQIEITEIPYEVVKNSLVKKIDDIRIDKEVNGITLVRDDSSREGLSIIIELASDANEQAILSYLYKKTDLQISYNFNMVAIHHQRPEQVGLKTALQAFIDFRKQVITKRTEFELDKAQKRQHIVEGLIKMLSILDEVIATIRGSKDRKDAQNNLIEKFDFTQQQAEAIVTLQLYRLTNTDVVELTNEHDELTKAIQEFKDILSDGKVLNKVLKEELKTIAKKYGTERRSEIQNEIEEIVIDQRALIADEEVVLSVSKNGYLKRSSIRSFNASSPEDGYAENDYPILRTQANTLHHLFMFTSLGNMIYRPIHEIADGKWKDYGTHLSQEITGMAVDETVISALVIENLESDMSFLAVADNGFAKVVELSELAPGRNYKKKASNVFKLKADAKAIVFEPIDKNFDQVVLTSNNNQVLHFKLEEIPVLGAKTAGVKGMDLASGDKVVSAVIGNNQSRLLTFNANGDAKVTEFADLPETSRARKGVSGFKPGKGQSDKVVAGFAINDNNDLIALTSNGSISDILVSKLIPSPRMSAPTKLINKKDAGLVELIQENKSILTEEKVHG